MRARLAAGYRLFAGPAAIFAISVFVLVAAGEVFAGDPVVVKIRDLTNIEGVRENPLIGYGMVVGLTQTGDSQQTIFTTQTLANIMQRMGAQIPAGTARLLRAYSKSTGVTMGAIVTRALTMFVNTQRRHG